VGGLSTTGFKIRRATLEDLEVLTALWSAMLYPVDELTRRLTEFQVAEDANGTVIGTLALAMTERQGLIHSEAFQDFSLADTARPLLWERLLALANSHGLLRVWTREQVLFWKQSGLNEPTPKDLNLLPAPWRGASSGWLTLKLREDVAALIAADKEFALMLQAEKVRAQRAMGRAKTLKTVAMMVAVALIIVAIVAAVLVLQRTRQALRIP
jgi:N-acetylglutamate synthase-like GNAT family acetyltransferase